MPYSSMGSDLGDVNNDGLIDLLVADMAATTHQKDQRGMADARGRTDRSAGQLHGAPQYQRNALYLNTGTGRCLEAAFLAGIAATDWTWSPRLEDLDNDGRLDLFVTNGMNRELHNADLLERRRASETPGGRDRGSCTTARCWPSTTSPSATWATCTSRTSARPGASTRGASASAPPSATSTATATSTSSTPTTEGA